MTPTPQEELKVVKARARKAAAKARADIAKAKQETLVMARDADRAREEARQARAEAAKALEKANRFQEDYLKTLALVNQEAQNSCEYIKLWLAETKKTDQLRAENARLWRQLEEGRPAPALNWDSLKIWEVSPN